MWLLNLLALLALAVVASSRAATESPVTAERPWLDASQPVAARVALLLPKLTLEEKIAMTFATHTEQAIVYRFNRTGVGATKFLSAFTFANVTKCVIARNALQALFMKEGRLGIPVSFINEGLHGGAPGGTIFPEPIGQGMSWNVSLVSKIAGAIAAEASAIGVDSVFAPVINMMTDPRFGRLQEGFGENPIMSSHMGRASVLALQGGPGNATTYLPEGHVVSLGKHFGAYGAALGGLNGGPADVSNRTLHEVFLRPWMALGRAGVRAVMPAHNTVGDVPCHSNKWMIQQKLREEYGFGEGVALSDCNDIGALYHFGMAESPTHAAGLGLEAGVDWDLQCGPDPAKWSYNKLGAAIDAGYTTEAALDKVVARVLGQKFAAGLFDGRAVTSLDKVALLDSAPHRQLALEAAEQGIVLLKNELTDEVPALPMALKGVKVVLFGPFASSNASAETGAKHAGGPAAATALVGSYVLSGADVVTVDQALRAAGAAMTWVPGCSHEGPPGSGCDDPKTGVAAAVAAAKAADVSLLVLGDGHGQCGEWQDRDSLDLAGGQLQLLEAVANVSKKTVVVLVHGRPQTFGLGNAALAKVDALLAAWRPGEEGGTAIVNLLTGKANPSAKLAQSWPRNVGQVHGGATPWLQRVRGKWVANHKGCDSGDAGRCYSPYVADGYESTPLFNFGSGLSYTQFEYVAMKLTPAMESKDALGRTFATTADSEAVWSVAVTVRNTGKVAGQEIVQLYVKDPAGLPFVPYWKRMLGFGRTPTLAPGASAVVTIKVLWVDLALFDQDMQLKLYPGTYVVAAGGASNITPLATNATIAK